MNLTAVTKCLSPAQIRSIHQSQSTPQLALWSGAVSSGKTIASLIAFLIALATAPDQGLIVIVGRTLQTIERNIIDPLSSVNLFGFVAGYVHHTPGSTVATILGRTVHLIGASDVKAEGRIRGATIALAYVDEATLVPQGFWMMLLSRLRVPGAKMLATTNPDGPAHWLRKDFILRPNDVGMRHWHFTLDDNPGLDPAYVALLKKQYVGLWYRRFILGDWCLAAGAVFEAFDEAVHVAHTLPQIVRWLCVGMDFGTTNATHAVLLGLGSDSRLYITNEWRHDSRTALFKMSNVEYSKAIRDWIGKLGVKPEWYAADPAAADPRLQLFRDGLTVMPADNEVLPGIQIMSSLFALGALRIHATCKHLLDEIPGYSWDEKAALEKGEDKPLKVDDHGIDAARYAIKSTEILWRSALQSQFHLAA